MLRRSEVEKVCSEDIVVFVSMGLSVGLVGGKAVGSCLDGVNRKSLFDGISGGGSLFSGILACY